MILDIPPHLEQAMIAQAQEQGLSVMELLQRKFLDDEPQLNADPRPLIVDETNAHIIQELLDNPPSPSPAMRELLRGE